MDIQQIGPDVRTVRDLYCSGISIVIDEYEKDHADIVAFCQQDWVQADLVRVQAEHELSKQCGSPRTDWQCECLPNAFVEQVVQSLITAIQADHTIAKLLAPNIVANGQRSIAQLFVGNFSPVRTVLTENYIYLLVAEHRRQQPSQG